MAQKLVMKQLRPVKSLNVDNSGEHYSKSGRAVGIIFKFYESGDIAIIYPNSKLGIKIVSPRYHKVLEAIVQEPTQHMKYLLDKQFIEARFTTIEQGPNKFCTPVMKRCISYYKSIK